MIIVPAVSDPVRTARQAAEQPAAWHTDCWHPATAYASFSTLRNWKGKRLHGAGSCCCREYVYAACHTFAGNIKS